MHGNSLTHWVRRVMRTAKIEGEPQQYCAHCLRTTFATICCEHGVPMAVIQSWLGHECQEVTRIYARFADDSLKRQAMAAFPDIG